MKGYVVQGAAVRKLCGLGFMAVMFSPLAMAQNLDVAANSLMRLPGNSTVVELQELNVAEYGTLLIPANLVELKIGHLHLGHEARIAVVPHSEELRLTIQQADLEPGSQILARGAPGTFEKPPLPARNLTLQIQALQGAELSVDARGGSGTPGYAGLDGAEGDPAGCTWGSATRGYNGDNGADGHDGSAGALVRLQLPASYPAEQIKVRVDGGAGGLGGAGGKAGAGGAGKGCLVYHADSGKAGRAGVAGQPGRQGPAGQVVVQRY
ncbi:collagen-like protein [Pseudomonas sp. dw_358]|uniref:collagen-like protein n=1 Tax=Pseudomonas sp. dw_358 TaxID=2720083 RepID=UPI0021170F48|nr:collagen-like protein [Pseudomonas sp. dw_358]